jgi:hypothetical protein
LDGGGEAVARHSRDNYILKEEITNDGRVDFVITVREYIERNQQFMRFYAVADKPVNQGVAPFIPFGWGETLLGALSECLKSIRDYPYSDDISRHTSS